MGCSQSVQEPPSPKAPAESVVLWTTSLSDEALAAHAALVYRERDQRSAAAQLGTQTPVIDDKRSRMAEPKRALAMRR